MQTSLGDLAKEIKVAFNKISAPSGKSRKPKADEIWSALNVTAFRTKLRAHLGIPPRSIYCRYSKCQNDSERRYRKNNHVFKVLEYLWDFSFSHFAIPQAMADPNAEQLRVDQKYKLIFVAESELDRPNDVCRDLLKLLESRCKIRCLIFKQRKRQKDADALAKRMLTVLNNHAYFRVPEPPLDAPDEWLFIGITWTNKSVSCEIQTLDDTLSRFVPIG